MTPETPVERRLREMADELGNALTLLAYALNGWGCYAKRDIEHREIRRLRQEGDNIRARCGGQEGT